MTFINLEVTDSDTAIYRVFNAQRLLELFALSKNTLVKPALWDDPLENYVLHAAMKAFSDHPNTFDFTTKDRIYGQCWSTLEESDAMWRIYSPDKSGVKVKTTIGKLLNSLQTSSGVDNSRCFIGKVKYMSGDTLKDKLQDRFWLGREVVDWTSQAASLLFKRQEFEHENEVRLIYINPDIAYSDNLFRYSINPTNLFDEVQFDPRISKELFDVFKFFLEDRLSYSKPISKSELYQVPQLSL
jgi:hypothetical protein